MRIVIYDSGVGGLSIYQTVHAALPEAEYVFISDNDAFPYGTKSESELLDRVHQVAASVVKHYQPDVFIVACNTASTLALDSLRREYSMRFIGVVPAIKPAAAISETRHIAVLATPATVARDYTQQLINEHAKGCVVELIAAPSMVNLAETKIRGGGVDFAELERILMPITSNATIDTLVLACTHYPLLRTEIEQVLGPDSHVKNIIDSADAIARRTQAVLAELMLEKSSVPASHAVERACLPTTCLPTTCLPTNSGVNVAGFTRREEWPIEFMAFLKQLGFAKIDYLLV